MSAVINFLTIKTVSKVIKINLNIIKNIEFCTMNYQVGHDILCNYISELYIMF